MRVKAAAWGKYDDVEMMTPACLCPDSLQAVHEMSGEVVWCLPEVTPIFEARGRVDGVDYKGEARSM